MSSRDPVTYELIDIQVASDKDKKCAEQSRTTEKKKTLQPECKQKKPISSAKPLCRHN